MASFLLRQRQEPGSLTLRITPSGDSLTLRLTGHLGAAEVPELERSAEAGIHALDLQELLTADEEGLDALRRLRARGIEVRNASRYLAIVLA